MPTVAKFGRWRLVMFTNDHEPAHVHLISSDGAIEAKLRLSDGEIIIQEGRLGPKLLREVRAWMVQNRARLAALWVAYHEKQ